MRISKARKNPRLHHVGLEIILSFPCPRLVAIFVSHSSVGTLALSAFAAFRILSGSAVRLTFEIVLGNGYDVLRERKAAYDWSPRRGAKFLLNK